VESKALALDSPSPAKAKALDSSLTFQHVSQFHLFLNHADSFNVQVLKV
jgi:hypothetical protein